MNCLDTNYNTRNLVILVAYLPFCLTPEAMAVPPNIVVINTGVNHR